MPLSDFCRGPVITASPDETVLHAAELMRDRKVGALVITEEDRPVGILTDRDLVMRVITERKDPFFTRIRDVMTAKPIVVSEAIGIWELIQTIKKHYVRRYPVVSGDGKLVGIITMDDLIELFAAELAGLGSAIAVEVGHEKPATV